MGKRTIKFIANIVGAILLILSAFAAYQLTDKTPPSFVIAMWIYPYELYPGQVFTAREIFVRNRLCYRHINQGFTQDFTIPDWGANQVASPPDLPWPRKYGVISESFDGIVPVNLAPGKALYVMHISWLCWWNPISWVRPYSVNLTYPVTILSLNGESFLERGNNFENYPHFIFSIRSGLYRVEPRLVHR